MPWSLGLIALALLSGGCWADFPESRFLLHDSTVTRPDGSPDGPSRDGLSDRGPGDLPSGEGKDLLAKDLPTMDGDLPAHDSSVHDSSGDLPKPDLMPTDLPKADSFTCTPGTFVRCASAKTLSRCNSSGDGVTNVNCGSASCVTALQRCDECNPTSPATCQGSALRTCTVDGLFTSTNCPLGCQNGACCVDGDKDGSSCDDCDDVDKNAFPGQTSYFSVARVSGGYDFNCNSTEEREFPDLVACVGAGSNCGGDGWVGTVPACGQTGQFASCVKNGGSCDQQPATTKTQTCR